MNKWPPILWMIGVLVVGMIAGAFLWQTLSPDNRAASKDIIFDEKVFSDLGAEVYIAGTLTGDGVAYKNNTTAITCNRERAECAVSSIEQIGKNQIGRLDSPAFYPITKWDQSEIVAAVDWPIFSSGFVHCRKTTISIERKSEAAVWVEEAINQSAAACKDSETRLFKWTIEDSPAWKALHFK